MSVLASQLFDFDLPSSLIAQHPADKRDESRLFVFNRKTGERHHTIFKHLLDYLPPQVGLVRNTVSVLKARIPALREGGGPVECFLLKPSDEEKTWWCLLRPSKKLAIGEGFGIDSVFRAKIVEKKPEGVCRVFFESELSVLALSEKFGQVPLPPYIKNPNVEESRYQTVYADESKKQAVAAPTAGLHFTPELLAKLERAGIPSYDLSLHVGLGTFQPIKVDAIQDHPMHAETYEISPETAQFVEQPGSRIRLAVGTTTTRALEHYMTLPRPLDENSSQYYKNRGHYYEANCFIYPPYSFKGVDALLTNFHLPRSTLLCLLAAFLAPGSYEGIELFKRLYQEAITRHYRFFSYGDAMLIL